MSVGVVLPILVLTYQQYRSLAELQNKTKGAFRDNLRQGLTLVQRQMKQRLEGVAAQTLNPIANIHASGSAEEIEKYFANVKRSHPEIEEIFAFAQSDGKEAKAYAYLYSDKFVKVAQADFSPAQSDILSLFDKARMAQSFVDSNRSYLLAYHSCPTCPPSIREGTYLFYPLKDPTNGGFAGILLNESFVRDDLIARTIREVSASHEVTNFPAMAVTISDENQRVLYSNGAAQHGYLFESNFDPPFSNWKAHSQSLLPCHHRRNYTFSVRLRFLKNRECYRSACSNGGFHGA